MINGSNRVRSRTRACSDLAFSARSFSSSSVPTEESDKEVGTGLRLIAATHWMIAYYDELDVGQSKA